MDNNINEELNPQVEKQPSAQGDETKNTLPADSSEDITAADYSGFDAENSTVFTKSKEPEKAKKQVKGASKKRRNMLIGLLVALVVLGAGAFGLLKFLPNLNNDQTSSSQPTIQLKKVSANDISKIEITNQSGSIVLLSTVKETTSSDANAVATSSVTWSLEGYDQSLMASSSIGSAADSIAGLTATRKMDDETLDYGLDNPIMSATVTMRDGSEGYTVYVGNPAPDGSGHYVKVTGVEGIYLVAMGTINNINSTPESLANTVIISAPALDDSTPASEKKYFDEEEGTLISFDSINMRGAFYEQEINLVPSDNDMAAFKVKAGNVDRYANDDNAKAMLGIVSDGIVAIDTYKLMPSQEDIAAYGLNNPDAIITISYGKNTVKLTAKKYDTENNYYSAMVEGRDAIYAVTAEALDMLSLRENDLYNEFVFLEYLNGFSNMTVKTPDKTYSFDIEYNKEEEEMTVTSEGKQVDDALLSAYYNYYVTVAPTAEENYIDASPSLTATFTYSDSAKGKITFELVKQSDRRYLVVIDGQKMGIISSSVYDHMVSYAQYVIDGKGIPEA